MEHIVQFGINIDDEAIKRTIMESGVKTSDRQQQSGLFYDGNKVG